MVTTLAWGASTHVGHTREVNEDSFVAAPPVFVVADGMGGHDRGEVASGLVAQEFAALTEIPELGADSVAEALRAAHAHVRRSDSGPHEREMGTTLAAAVLVQERGLPHWLIVNVGDSRVYRLVGDSLQQLSIDHSAVQELVSAGQLSEEDARTHPDRHVITRAVGIGDTVVADFALRDPELGERFLLCSDGVHGQLTDEEILLALRAPDPQDAATALIESVLAGRANDNLTAVVVDVLSVDEWVAGSPDDGLVDEDTSPRSDAEASGESGVDAEESEAAERVPDLPDAPDAPDGEGEFEELSDAIELLEVPPGHRVTASEPNSASGVEVIEVPKW